MSIESLILDLHRFDEAATILFDQKFIVPGLALLYTGIDIASSLERLGHEGTKSSFMRWSDSYLLRNSTLSCTSADLYSARCGILHAHTPESDLTRKGKAKKILYAWGTATANSLDAIARHAKRSDEVNIHVNDLLDAFRIGIDEWIIEVRNNSTRTAKVEKRSMSWFTNLPKEMIEEALKGIPKEREK